MWLLEITSPQTLYLLDSSSLRLVPTAFVDSIALLGAEEQVLLTCFFFKFYFYFFIFCKYFHTISCMTPLFLFGKITKQQYTYARHLKTIAVALEHKVKHVPMYAVAYRGPWKLIWNGFNDGSTAPPPHCCLSMLFLRLNVHLYIEIRWMPGFCIPLVCLYASLGTNVFFLHARSCVCGKVQSCHYFITNFNTEC